MHIKKMRIGKVRKLSRSERADPRRWHTYFWALKRAPLSRLEHELIDQCVSATRRILADKSTITGRIELAAVMHAYALAEAEAICGKFPPYHFKHWGSHEFLMKMIAARALELRAQERA